MDLPSFRHVEMMMKKKVAAVVVVANPVLEAATTVVLEAATAVQAVATVHHVSTCKLLWVKDE